MTSTIFETRLTHKIPRVGDIVSFRFSRPDRYEYAAGQWHVVTIPADPEPLTHHFTHSSSPTEPHLEFTTRLRGTAFKNRLDALPLGTAVEMEGPFGSFTMDAATPLNPVSTGGATVGGGPRQLVFITGGIGITPVRSILRWQADTGVAPPTLLIYANSSEQTIAFRDEIDHVAETLPDFRAVYVVSRPSPAWIGRTGHIDAVLLAEELNGFAAATYYVSGPPSMVQAIRETLLSRGVDRGCIKTELFEGYD